VALLDELVLAPVVAFRRRQLEGAELFQSQLSTDVVGVGADILKKLIA